MLKDASSLHLDGPDRFRGCFKAKLKTAKPYAAVRQAEDEAASREAYAACRDLAEATDILDRFAVAIARMGVAGETVIAMLIYLAVVSRLLSRPVSVAVKGPSSGGKSYLTEQVLKYFPEGAF